MRHKGTFTEDAYRFSINEQRRGYSEKYSVFLDATPIAGNALK